MVIETLPPVTVNNPDDLVEIDFEISMTDLLGDTMEQWNTDYVHDGAYCYL